MRWRVLTSIIHHGLTDLPQRQPQALCSRLQSLQGLTLEVAPGATVAQVAARLGLPAAEITLIMVDGRRQEADFSLQGSERLGLFPPIGGG